MSEQKVPQMSGMKQVVWHPGTQVEIPISAERALIDNQITMSKNQKLRGDHTGTIDLERDQGRTEREVVSVTATQTILDTYGIDNRPYINVSFPIGLIGQTIKVPVDSEVLTMPLGDLKPNELDGNEWADGSSSSANDTDLIEPTPAFVADSAQPMYSDLPGKIGGPVMNDDNYLTFSGAGKEIPGDL